MQIYDLKELLNQAYNDGFTVESISKATGVPAELINRYYNGLHIEKAEITELDNVLYLLMELYRDDVVQDEYIRGIVQTLGHFFDISDQTIANYLNVGMEELESLMQNPYGRETFFRASLKLLHLFMTFVRDKQ